MYAIETGEIIKVVSPYNKKFIDEMHRLDGKFKNIGGDKWWEVPAEKRAELEYAIESCYPPSEKSEYVFVTITYEKVLTDLKQAIEREAAEVKELIKPLTAARFNNYRSLPGELEDYESCIDFWTQKCIAEERYQVFSDKGENYEYSAKEQMEIIETSEEAYNFFLESLQDWHKEILSRKQAVLNYIERKKKKNDQLT